jgi:hypothetical protein
VTEQISRPATLEDLKTLLRSLNASGVDYLLIGGYASPLPFVYLFGRADFTVSYFGANIYPENVSVGLEQAAVRIPRPPVHGLAGFGTSSVKIHSRLTHSSFNPRKPGTG